MKKIKTIILQGVIASLLPAICSLLGTTDILDYLKNNGYIGLNSNIVFWKNILSIIGVLTTFAFITVGLIISSINEEKYKIQCNQLLTYNKDILINALTNYLGSEYCDLNIRVFVPDKSICSRLAKILNKESPLWFHIKNIEGLAETGITDNLKFKVYPDNEREGLVGECYHLRKMVYDENLEKNNDSGYNLSEYQKNKTRQLKFVIACPTFCDKGIDAIVTFDSRNHIKIVDEDKFTSAVLIYSQQLHECVPQLFKPKGGLFK
jgi:hypothetical protein